MLLFLSDCSKSSMPEMSLLKNLRFLNWNQSWLDMNLGNSAQIQMQVREDFEQID